MARRLTRDEAAKLLAFLRPKASYLRRLIERMEGVGFAADNEVLQLAREASEHLQALTAELHGVTVRGNVHRRRP